MKKLLLHTCCAPCLAYVYELLQKQYDITIFFYNPNICPKSEYDRRLNELINYTASRKVPLIKGQYEINEWHKEVHEFRFYGEKSIRCDKCFQIRLNKSFKKAIEIGAEYVTTALSISPHKSAESINRTGKLLSIKYDRGFIEADFKKNDGFNKSVNISRKNNFYRQKYCGCSYSLLENRNDSKWKELSIEIKKSLTKNN